MKNESELIAKYFSPLALSEGALSLQDDAAFYRVPKGQDLILTHDILVEGVHYLPQTSPENIALKLCAVNISDLAAKGATPKACLLGFSPSMQVDENWIACFARAFGKQLKRYGISLLGGDSVALPSGASFALTLLGHVPQGQMIKRSGAQIGDDIYVSGVIGRGALGLQDAKIKQESEFYHHFISPVPRLALGQALRGIIHAAADISDGLVADAENIAKASGCGMDINIENIPFPLTKPKDIDCLLGGGDDYELIFTAAPLMKEKILQISQNLNIPLTVIGVVTHNTVVKFWNNGQLHIPRTRGYSHF